MKNAYLAMPSPFTVEHRLIFYWPVIAWPKHGTDQGSIGQDLERALATLLALHPTSRGLIHSVSYPRTQLLMECCASLPRLIAHGNDEGEFEDALSCLNTTPGAVLVSPRALEGVDLKGAMSEFQIFIKLPFPSLGDPRVKKRKETARGWYDLMVAIAVIQGCGRSVRTASDIAPTYILDVNWGWWFKANRHLFPDYFKQAVRPMPPSRI